VSVVVRNGKVELERKPKGIDAPSPSQIAERAYDLATRVVVQYLEKHHDGAYNDCGTTSANIEDALDNAKAATLAGLRESVISPGFLPWWRKP
jgi:hypothetical protein